MATPHGYATFPGINQILSCSYTMTTGIQPGVVIIEMAPQGNFPAAGGPLKLWYGSTTITIPDCKIDKASVRYDDRGQIVSLALFDWRWRWSYPAVSGWYNTFDHETGTKNMIFPDPDADIDKERVRNARDLAKICLDWMKQKVYDVSALPIDIFPPVDWEYQNAAIALQAIAEQCGCVVVPTLAGTVAVARKGVGKPLPAGPLLDGGISIDPPEIPDAIEFVGGPTLFQIMFQLAPVGLDTDGKVKPINQLSYAPTGGWTTVDPCEFYSLAGGKVESDTSGARNSPRDLAQRTIWKWYSVFSTEVGINVPGYGKITDINQVIPLNDYRLETVTQDGEERRKEATVFGTYAKRDGTTENEERREYKYPFQINGNRGLVIFDRPVFKYGGTAKYRAVQEANLQLWTSCNLRVPPTWGFLRKNHRVNLPGAKWNTGPKYLVKDDVVFEHTVRYNKDGAPIGFQNNSVEIQKQIDYYIKAELDSYQIKDPESRTYAGLLPISLDGAISQVTWNITDRGTTTQASRNSEHSDTTPPFEVRKRWDDIRRVTDRTNRGVKQGSPSQWGWKGRPTG